MTTKEKLELMDEIKAANENHVKEWKAANMKVWVADYGFIDADGNKFEETENDPFGAYRIQIEALDIQAALDEAKKRLLEMAAGKGWQTVRIYNIGICNENIW
mgnify:CR=1 FL=1